MAAKPKTFLSGAGLVWRRQGALWWIYIVNAALALLSAGGMVERAGDALNHSLAAQRLVHGFSLGALTELMSQPEAPLELPGTGFLFFPFVFLVFLLFATGGVLALYYRDERLTAGPFFEACGQHFWRFLRLLVYLVIAFIPIGIVGGITGQLHDHIDEAAISPYPAVEVFAAGAVVILLLLMCLRLWFDMAQVIAVAEDEKRMHKALRRSAALLRRNFGSLFWLYFRISLIGWVVCGLALQWWKNYVSPESGGAAFFLGQFIIVFWLSTRLWQRASEAMWYRQYQMEALTGAGVTEPEPVLTPVGAAAPVR